MLRKSLIICVGTAFFFQLGMAQTISLGELYERGELSHHGYNPKSLATMVGSSSLIVKGKFHKKLGTEDFYGFGRTREELERTHNLSEIQLDDIAILVTTYEIYVDEVFLGDRNVEGGTVLFRLNEPVVVDNIFITDEERLFFLVSNPDGSYSALGPESVQISRNGRYVYDSLAPSNEQFEGKALEVVESAQGMVFEEAVRREIDKL